MNVREQLEQLRACREAVEWASQFGTLEEAWAKCERGDWMLWFAGKHSGPAMSDGRKPLVLAACSCARLSLKYVKPGEDCSLRAIELAERWARGEDSPYFPGSPITQKALRNAADVAADVAAAYAAVTAVTVTVAAAYVAASAAANVSAAAARKEILMLCADIVRTYYPTPPAPQQEKQAAVYERNCQ